jgi:hypothetical protein
MKLESLSEHQKIAEKTQEIVISNHGVTYKIISNFYGICIENDHPDGIRTRSGDNKNLIVIS